MADAAEVPGKRRACKLAPVNELEPDRRLLRIHYDWLEAGELS